jgi:hypothetical protein
MAVQRAFKTYPALKWALALSGVIVVVALVMSGLVTDANNADLNTFLIGLAIAVVLPFLALLIPRRQVVTMELPSDQLVNADRKQLQGILDSLDAAKAKGEIPPDRYAKARDRVVAAMKGK